MLTTLILLGIIVFMNIATLSIDVLVLSIMLILIAYKYEKKPKFDYLYYLAATLLAVVCLFINIQVIRSGLIAFAMFNVVMFTGVTPDKWMITKKLKTYRSFYSILGFILILPHGLLNLFVEQQINLFGIGSMVLMIPLFITSFNIVKKEVKAEEWIKLQKVAYLIYILLFIHLISVAEGYGKIVYAVLMTLYINNKLLKEFRK